jgi:hypothetical protein
VGPHSLEDYLRRLREEQGRGGQLGRGRGRRNKGEKRERWEEKQGEREEVWVLSGGVGNHNVFHLGGVGPHTLEDNLEG